MNEHKKFWLTCVLSALLTACAGHSQRPQWIDSPQTAYPTATYLTGVGSGDNRQTATDRAFANLARVFEVAVSDTTLDFSSAQINGQQTVNEQKVSRNISVEARKVVAGASIAESWTAPDGRVYALATLNKQAAANGFRSAILSADRDVDQLIDYAGHTADSPVAALHALKRARKQAIHREELNRNLMVVANGHGIKGRYDVPAVENMLRDALANLKVAVDTGDNSIRAEIQRALAQLGVSVVNQSNLMLSGSLDTAPVESHGGWFWQRGSYELIFRDGTRVLAKQRWPIKVSSTDRGILASRVRDEINAQLPNHVFELLSTQP